MSRFRNLLMIIAPIVVVGISLGIYYAVNKEQFTSCTCSKDKDSEKYTYTHNQPKKDLQITLQPVNSFGPSTIEQVRNEQFRNEAEPAPAKERYTTAYYKEPQNNPETHGRFSGV